MCVEVEMRYRYFKYLVKQNFMRNLSHAIVVFLVSILKNLTFLLSSQEDVFFLCRIPTNANNKKRRAISPG